MLDDAHVIGAPEPASGYCDVPWRRLNVEVLGSACWITFMGVGRVQAANHAMLSHPPGKLGDYAAAAFEAVCSDSTGFELALLPGQKAVAAVLDRWLGAW